MQPRFSLTGAGVPLSSAPLCPAQSPPAGPGARRVWARVEDLPAALADMRVTDSGHSDRQAAACSRFSVSAEGQARLPWLCLSLQESPDGRWLACAGKRYGNASRGQVLTLFERGEAGLRGVFVHDHGCPVPVWMFSADSRRLEGLDERGQWLCWCPDAQDQWRQASSEPLCPGPVTTGRLSPDGQCLVVNIPEALLLFEQTGTAGWQLQWRRETRQKGMYWAFMDRWRPEPEPLLFSPDSQSLLFANEEGTFHYERSAGCWQGHKRPNNRGLDSRESFQAAREAVFDSSGRCLALAFPGCQKKDVNPGSAGRPVAVDLWQRRQGGCWRLTASRVCTAAPGWAGWCLRFSPDGQILALPVRQDSGDCRQGVWLLATGLDSPSRSDSLMLPFELQRPGLAGGDIDSLQFSADGRRLFACSSAGVQVWQRDGVQGWLSVLRLAQEPGQWSGIVRGSPDGMHLAQVCGARGEVSIWGPAPGGDYIRKAGFEAGQDVNELLFLSGGRRVLVSCLNLTAIPGVISTDLTLVALVPEGAGLEADSQGPGQAGTGGGEEQTTRLSITCSGDACDPV